MVFPQYPNWKFKLVQLMLIGAPCNAQVNSSPFEDGWMMKVKLSDPAELDDLMDSVTYESTCEDH